MKEKSVTVVHFGAFFKKHLFQKSCVFCNDLQ